MSRSGALPGPGCIEQCLVLRASREIYYAVGYKGEDPQTLIVYYSDFHLPLVWSYYCSAGLLFDMNQNLKSRINDKDTCDFRWDTQKTKYASGEILLMHQDSDSAKKYVKLSRKYSDAIMLWDDLLQRATPSKERNKLLDNDWKHRAPTCYFWISSSQDPRNNADIFVKAGKGFREDYDEAWERALQDAVEHSLSIWKERNGQQGGKMDLKNRYFSTPANWKSPLDIVLVPHGDWLKCDALVAYAGTTKKDQKFTFSSVRLRDEIKDFDTATWITKDVVKTLAPKFMNPVWQKIADAGDGLLKLSTHPLDLYSTWTRISDVNMLINAQTQGTSTSWTRPFPSRDQVQEFNQKLTGDFARDLVANMLVTSLPLRPGDPLPTRRRMQTKTIMGDSANQWATGTLKWNDGDRIAEWLHREGHRFDQTKADRFSNIIFGTSECNTHMMRAEATLKSLLASKKVAAVRLETKAINSVEMLENITNGVPNVKTTKGTPWWQANDLYCWWIAPQLDYTISFQPKYHDTILSYTTPFKPFHRYRPFRFEVDLDELILVQYLDRYPKPTLVPVDWNPKLNSEYEMTGGISSADEADYLDESEEKGWSEMSIYSDSS
ncbi:hypothetical protein VNI00_019409 [Paramarasmius palmivorus]|uniref:Uncharacterized protein n=1 Tax=Paramarasmius palmivorus TaxID=297713 RepID=A0AAW0AM07_9AGAR